MKIITAEYFEKATGQAPEQDDLERCNCAYAFTFNLAGETEHDCCGWNHKKNLPIFMARDEEVEAAKAALRKAQNNLERALDNAKYPD